MNKNEELSQAIATTERQISEAPSELAKKTLTKKLERLKEELRTGEDKSTSAISTLSKARKEVRNMANKDFKALITKLTKKPEYAFLENYSVEKLKDDLKRVAKPKGYRFVGENTNKPTISQIKKGLKDGTVYYEGRPIRSDVSRVVQLKEGGKVEDCIDYIKNSESIRNNGYYLNINSLNNYVDSGAKIPKIKPFCLITFNSGGQKNLKAIDTINATLLSSEIAKLLNIDIELARIIVSEQTTRSKRFTMDMLDKIKNNNIIVADRETIVCTNLSNKFAEGGAIASSIEFKPTRVTKGFYGWVAKTVTKKPVKGYDWEITTMKRSSGDLVTTANGGKYEDGDGYTTFTFSPFEDPSLRLMLSTPRMVNEKAVTKQHEEAVQIFMEKIKEMKGNEMMHGGSVKAPIKVKKRLEAIRKSIQNENVSYGEMAELQSLSKDIDPSDVELREAAGMPQFEDEDEMMHGGSLGDYLPPAKTYKENLAKAMDKFDISDNEARKRYGQYTIKQWSELLGEKMAKGGSVGYAKDLKETEKLIKAFVSEYGSIIPITESQALKQLEAQEYLGRGASSFNGLTLTSSVADKIPVGDTKPRIAYVKLSSDINPNGISGKDDVARTYTISVEIKGKKRLSLRTYDDDGTYFKVYNFGRTIKEVLEKIEDKMFQLKRMIGKDDLKFTKLYATGGKLAKVEKGDIITSTTGVKVKVIDYDPLFGGRVRATRMDEYGDGKVSQWMPLKKFKFKDGGNIRAYFYLPQEDISKLVLNSGQKIDNKRILDGAYIKGSKSAKKANYPEMERAMRTLEELKSEGKLKRFYDVRRNGKKSFETIIPNKEDKGYWKRYESASRGSLGILQNEFLSEEDVLNYILKTQPKLAKPTTRELYEMFESEKKTILLGMIARGVAEDFMRDKFDKTMDWDKLSDEEKEEYNKAYKVKLNMFDNFLASEFLQLYYEKESIQEKCKGTSRKTIDAIESVLRNIAKEYPEEKYDKGGNIDSDISKYKKQLIAKAKSKGLYENFGQDEVSKLEDKYGYTNEVRAFDNWAMNFDLSSLKQYATGGGVSPYSSGMSEAEILKATVVYDNGGETLDRYTVFTPDSSVFGMSETGGGFNQYIGDDSEIEKGSHLGKRLKTVPKDIKSAVLNRMIEEEFADGGMMAKGGSMDSKKVYVYSGYNATATKDDYEEGELEDAGDWNVNEAKTFQSKQELIDYINENIIYSDYKESNFDWETGEGTNIQTDVLCSYDDYNGYFPASGSEKELWKKGKNTLYNVHYWISVMPIIPTKFKKGGKAGYEYIPNEDISKLIAIDGNEYPRNSLLDGAYVTDKVRKPKMSRTQFEDDSYEYGQGGNINFEKHIWEGWTIEDLEPTFNQIMSGRSWQKPFTTKQEVKEWCMDNQPYYKKHIPEVVNYFWAKVDGNKYALGGEITPEERKQALKNYPKLNF